VLSPQWEEVFSLYGCYLPEPILAPLAAQLKECPPARPAAPT
jgi:hypothetical protein